MATAGTVGEPSRLARSATPGPRMSSTSTSRHGTDVPPRRGLKLGTGSVFSALWILLAHRLFHGKTYALEPPPESRRFGCPRAGLPAKKRELKISHIGALSPLSSALNRPSKIQRRPPQGRLSLGQEPVLPPTEPTVG